MSGHSHWASIKHKKGLADAKKGKIFSKMARLIMIAAKEGGGDIKNNIKLQMAIEKARSFNMPGENIDRAIKKGAGGADGISLETMVYEGYGPGGAAVMVETLTDNRKRTGPEIRKIFELHGSNLGDANCARIMFDRKGVISIPSEKISEDDLMTAALDAGAEDVSNDGELFTVITDPKDLDKVKNDLKTKGFAYKTAEVTLTPKNYITLNKHDGDRIVKLMDALEDHDDVQNVYANFDLMEE